ncbi:MAG: tetratricopeptide repeat protein, partial [Clostridium sp.]|nr:tetratricopeptide repeat protein [Clostridium sp.]
MIKLSINRNVSFALLIVCLLSLTACKKPPNASNDKSNTITSDTNNKIGSKTNSENTLSVTEKEKEIKELQNTLETKYSDAHAAFFNHKYEEAIKISNEIIMQDNSFYKAYNVKGITLCFSNKFQEGMENIDKALNINPNFGYARFNKALAYELYGNYDEALKWYDKALEVENYIWSYYGKASIYGRLGDVENTTKYLKIAIDMDANVKNEAKKEKDFD